MKKLPGIFSLLLVILVSGCGNENFHETDKIRILFLGGSWVLDESEKVVPDPEQVELSIQMDFENISNIEIIDKSPGEYHCGEHIPASLNTIAIFATEPQANIKAVDFRIRLPCSAYHNNFILQIKVKSSSGNYTTQKRLPIILPAIDAIE